MKKQNQKFQIYEQIIFQPVMLTRLNTKSRQKISRRKFVKKQLSLYESQKIDTLQKSQQNRLFKIQKRNPSALLLTNKQKEQILPVYSKVNYQIAKSRISNYNLVEENYNEIRKSRIQSNQKKSITKNYSKVNRKDPLQIRIKNIQKSPYIKGKIQIQKIMKMLRPVKGPNSSLKQQILKYNESNKKNHEAVLKRNNNKLFEVKRKQYLLRIGLQANDKVFIMNSRDDHIRKALIRRGWKELDDNLSTFFHLKWAYSDSKNDYSFLQNGQLFNHFYNNQQITNKNNLRKNIKALDNNDRPKVPFTFDLGINEENKQFMQLSHKFQAFKILNILIKTISQKQNQIYKRIINNNNYFNHLNFKNSQKFKRKNKQFKIYQYLIQGQITIEKRNKVDKIIYLISILIKVLQKQTKIKYSIFPRNLFQQYNSSILLNLQDQIQNQEYYLKGMTNFFKVQLIKLNNHLLKLQILCFNSYGSSNIWIIKPTGVSRGTGISIQSDYKKILSQNNSFHGKIIQKYIQKPLLLKDQRKFDLRQWILVKSFYPLQAYYFYKCYGRICPQKYEQSNFNHIQKHLTNYSLSKQFYNHNKKKSKSISQIQQSSVLFNHIILKKKIQPSIILEQNLIEQFEQKNKQNKRRISWKQIKQRIKYQILKVLKGCTNNITDNKNCFQVYGFDILLDQNYCPYILQVNLSPACQNRQGLEAYLEQMSHGLLQYIEQKIIKNYHQNMNKNNIFNQVWQKLDQTKILKQIQKIQKINKQEKAVLIIQNYFRKKIKKKIK